MQTIDLTTKLQPPIVIALGYFDSVHLGHRTLIDQLLDCAKKHNAKSVITTFLKQLDFTAVYTLAVYTLEERLDILKSLNIDFVLKLPFTTEFKSQSPQEFLATLVSNLNIKAIVVGHDFKFGKDRLGDINTLENFCTANNIELKIMPPYPNIKNRISTSEIKTLIIDGDFLNANKLLGSPFFITGKVVKGKGRGKTLGFPTANIEVSPYKIMPKDGVYKTQTTIDYVTYDSITHIGEKQTFVEDKDPSIETHIINFSGDLYDKTIKITFLNFIRTTKKFRSAQKLANQIQLDLKS